jgi:hypothetical protein
MDITLGDQGSAVVRMKFRAGDYVKIRSRTEILSTLDANGCLDGMPFMPEMLQFCGKELRVWKSAHKTCDTVSNSGGRRISDTVHLEGTRCDGSAHDGCHARCNLFWKNAWLRPLSVSEHADPKTIQTGVECSEQSLVLATRKTACGAEPPIYVCQATQILDASTPLPWWDVRQYILDVTTGNIPARDVVRGLLLSWFAAWKRWGFPWRISQWAYERAHRLLVGRDSALRHGLVGRGQPTPTDSLGLEAGDLVRVKPHAEILKTVNVVNRNRGMLFDPELVRYCGEKYRVSHRVERIIDEATGKMIHMKNPCLVLEGVICRAEYAHRRMFCPRADLPYWREIWLERADRGVGGDSATAPDPFEGRAAR